MMLGTEMEAKSARVPMVIFSCSRCGRSVKVFGKVSRVLCACGQTLFDTKGAARGIDRRVGKNDPDAKDGRESIESKVRVGN